MSNMLRKFRKSIGIFRLFEKKHKTPYWYVSPLHALRKKLARIVARLSRRINCHTPGGVREGKR